MITCIRAINSDIAIIFVHGFWSNSKTAWGKDYQSSWVNLVVQEVQFQDDGVYVFDYPTRFLSNNFNLRECSNLLLEELYYLNLHEKRRLIFVCHSMGGIIVKKMLIENEGMFIRNQTIIGILLVSCPSMGSSFATKFAGIAKAFNNSQAIRLIEENPWLEELDEQFQNLIGEQTENLRFGRDNFFIYGKEIYEDLPLGTEKKNIFIYFLKLSFLKEPIVPKSSAARNFPKPQRIVGSDHISISKPHERESQQHIYLCNLIKSIHNYRIDDEIFKVRKKNIALKSEMIFIGHLPTTGAFLYGRDQKLEQLNHVWDNSDINVLSQIASGGIGKTTLINHWLIKLSKENYRSASKIFAWSFYTQGVTELVVSADVFMDFALKWFGDVTVGQSTAWEKGVRLANLIRMQKTLLIIDGLEPLQYPPGPREGRLRDVSVVALLRELASYNPGLCIITSRLPISDLRQFQEKSYLQVDLEVLSPAAGAQLLHSLGVNGNRKDLEKASEDFGGHSLALTLLGNFLRIVYKGDIHSRHKVDLLEQDKIEGGHAERVMASYEKWFEKGSELQFLYVLALFDRPIDENILMFIKNGETIGNLTDSLKSLSYVGWQRIINKLNSTGLISRKVSGKTMLLDTHPLTREYFRKRLIGLDIIAWRKGNDRLFEYYKNTAEDFPNTIKEMEPLFFAIIHGCEAKRYNESLHDIYISRLMRGEICFAENKLGATGALLSVISYFFQGRNWENPVRELDEMDQLFALQEAGRLLTETSGYASNEVGNCYNKEKILSEVTHNSRGLFESLLGLCRYHRLRGELRESGEVANKLDLLYGKLKDDFYLPAVMRAQSSNFFYIGDFIKTYKFARKGAITYADSKQAVINAQIDVNEPSISCFGYCALALWFLGYPDQAISKSNETLNKAYELANAHTLAITMWIDVMVYHFIHDPQLTALKAKALIDYCREKGFILWRLAGEILYAWSSAHIERSYSNFSSKIKENINSWIDAEAKLFTPYWYAILAEVYLVEEKYFDGLTAVSEGFGCSNVNGEHWWDSELWRLKGELTLLDSRNFEEAEKYFREGLNIAKAQRAKSLELRNQVSIVQVLNNFDKKIEEKINLSKIFDWFQEGFEKVDLMAAMDILRNMEYYGTNNEFK